MASAIVFPQNFSYVGAAIMSTVWVLVGQSFIVGRKRAAAKVEYPQAYASKELQDKSKEAMIFNCAQRAHANTLELMPIIWASTVVAGLKYPIPAAASCFVYSFSRIFYTRGYLTGDPKRRTGVMHIIGEISAVGCLFAATWVSGNWILENLRH